MPTNLVRPLLLSLLLSPLLAAATQPDPLQSVMWEIMKRNVLHDQPTVFDERVKVTLPRQVEDGQRVPVSVDASALGSVSEMVLFADYNPLPEVLRFEPLAMMPQFSVAMRVNQATPVRVAARGSDGVWHVGGQLVDAPGGGCALPTPTRASTDWGNLLGHMYGRGWHEASGSRIRLRIMHPMDTGLVNNTPLFHLQSLQLRDDSGSLLARLQLGAPLAENPLFTFQLPTLTGSAIQVAAQDNDGNQFRGTLQVTP